MALQLFKIASVEVSSPQSYIQFDSIPQGYTDLIIKVSARSDGTSAPSFYLQFNLSGGTAYSDKWVAGTGTSVISNSNSGLAFNRWDSFATGNDDTTGTFSNIELYIPNYTSSNYKSILIDSVKERNSGSSYNFANGLGVGLWAGTPAITTVVIDFDGNLLTDSTFTIYGVL